jgi:hypothetical protein
MKFDKFHINLSSGMEKFAFTIKNDETSDGGPCGALTGSKVDEIWAEKFGKTTELLKNYSS